jgi:hypothetical protein
MPAAHNRTDFGLPVGFADGRIDNRRGFRDSFSGLSDGIGRGRFRLQSE